MLARDAARARGARSPRDRLRRRRAARGRLSSSSSLADLGGSAYRWTSPITLSLLVAAIVAPAGFLFVERRAAEPVLPLRLFANRAFAVTSGVGFVVGFALFGSVTYLPLFLQVAKSASPTGSGLQMLPMMGGMLLTSIISGQIISRTGRYKIFPVVGTAVMTLGLFLLSRMRRRPARSPRRLMLVHRARARHGDAGARDRGAERGRLSRSRRRHSGATSSA